MTVDIGELLENEVAWTKFGILVQTFGPVVVKHGEHGFEFVGPDGEQKGFRANSLKDVVDTWWHELPYELQKSVCKH